MVFRGARNQGKNKKIPELLTTACDRRRQGTAVRKEKKGETAIGNKKS